MTTMSSTGKCSYPETQLVPGSPTTSSPVASSKARSGSPGKTELCAPGTSGRLPGGGDVGTSLRELLDTPPSLQRDSVTLSSPRL